MLSLGIFCGRMNVIQGIGSCCSSVFWVEDVLDILLEYCTNEQQRITVLNNILRFWHVARTSVPADSAFARSEGFEGEDEGRRASKACKVRTKASKASKGENKGREGIRRLRRARTKGASKASKVR